MCQTFIFQRLATTPPCSAACTALRGVHRLGEAAQPLCGRPARPPESGCALRRRNTAQPDRFCLFGARLVDELSDAVSIIKSLCEFGNLALVFGYFLRGPLIQH